ncbi:MAG: LysR family transcriptional regulator [Deltaproteobacteria bacterium]|nr:LysR family transcriptional regulator [Deltaproteobacteria bacterium]
MDLNRATTFVRVVETGGFTRAAEALGLPPSSISRAVSKLEEDLGVTLLERTTRSIALTDAGKAFFERAREALAGLEEANSLALDAAREVHGVVRLAVPPELGAKLGGVFGTFAAEHPKVRIEVTFTTRGAELVGDLVDIALVIGQLPDSSLVTRRLGESTDRLYAAPGYVKEHGQPRRVADLAKHETILSRAVGGEARWELTGPRGVERVDVHARMIGDHMQFLIDAAVAGLGIALLPMWVGDNFVKDGKLVAILPKFETKTPLHVLTHGGRHLPRRVGLLRDFLFDTLTVVCGRKEHSGGC